MDGANINHFSLDESLQWEPVEFFNNKIICDLVEEKHKGIIAILVSCVDHVIWIM